MRFLTLGAALLAAALPAGAQTLVVKNSTSKPIKVSLDEKAQTVILSEGQDLPAGGAAELKGAAGEYAVGGASVRLGDAPATVTLKETETEYVSLRTVVVEDAAGSRVSILQSSGKVTEGQVRREPDVVSAPAIVSLPRRFFSWLPYPHIGFGILLGHRWGRGHRHWGHHGRW